MTNETNLAERRPPREMNDVGTPSMSPEDGALPDNEGYEAWDLEALADIPNYQDWIVHNIHPFIQGEAVEIGAGIGTFSSRLLAFADRLDLVEPAPNLAAALKKDFAGNPKVEVISKTAENYLANAPVNSRDSIVIVNVLEHIKDDAQVIAEFFKLLRPGGHLLVFVPALSWLFSPMDTALGHYRRYGKGTLTAPAREAGFEIVSIRYFDVLGVIPWWIVHTRGGKTRFSPRLSKLYDSLFVPVGRAIESLVPPPLGKNLLLVARKPDMADTIVRKSHS